MKNKAVFFTFVSDDYYGPVGTPVLINSFKKLHPDVDLVVFRQDMINKVFAETGVNFYNAKPTFAKLLVPYYDLVVNIDADSIVLGRLDEVLKDAYDIGAPTNFNDYENMSIENVTKEMFLNAGLVASRNENFWHIWEKHNRSAQQYIAKENTVLNLLWYNHSEVRLMRRKIFDQHKDYYGCKSLNREHEFYMEDTKVMCRGEQVFIYHVAKGAGLMPKFRIFQEMGFPHEVAEFMKFMAYEGTTVKYGTTF
jgi:hypothetical protein